MRNIPQQAVKRREGSAEKRGGPSEARPQAETERDTKEAGGEAGSARAPRAERTSCEQNDQCVCPPVTRQPVVSHTDMGQRAAKDN